MEGVNSVNHYHCQLFGFLELLIASHFAPLWSPTSTTCGGRVESEGGRNVSAGFFLFLFKVSAFAITNTKDTQNSFKLI